MSKNMLWMSLLCGCSSGGEFTVSGDPKTYAPKPLPTTQYTPPTTPPPPDPCLDIPSEPLSFGRIEGPEPSEEFAFDAHGNAWNLPDGDGAVFRTPFGGPTEFSSPFEAVEVAGVRVLLDGDLAVANEWSGAVERVDLQTGSRTLLIGGMNGPNSLSVDEQGRLYVGSYGEILRVDPDSLLVETILELDGADIDGLTFSPDYRVLYFNSDATGQIGKIALNKDGTVGDTNLHAEISVSYWNELDGMATDMCGNVFAARVDGTVLRITPAGDVSEYITLDAWATALSFGSGVGGWSRDHLYVMDRGEGLIEIDAGVGGRPEPHLAE